MPTSKKQKSQRAVKQQRPSYIEKRSRISFLWRSALLILLAAVLGSSAVYVNSVARSRLYDCTVSKCSKFQVQDLHESSSHLVQDFDVTMKFAVQKDVFLGPPKSPTLVPPDGINQMSVFLVGNGKVMTRVPERFGSNRSFDITSPALSKLTSVRFRVVDGREVFIYLNARISYSHRYQIPIFFSDPNSLIQTSASDSGYVASISVAESRVFRENAGLNWLANILFLLFGAILSLLLAGLLLERFQTPTRENIQRKMVPAVGWILAFWIVSIGAWVIKPFDPTGAANPGLFGPIGAAFSDYFQIAQMSHFSRPYDFDPTLNYPPFALALLRGISTVLPNLLGMAGIVAVCLGILIFMLVKVKNLASRRFSLENFLIFAFPYPLIFGIVRGNIDLVAVALVWLALLLKDSKTPILPASLLACAIAIKIWPIVFVIFLIRWKKWRISIMSVAFSGLLTLLSALLLGYTSASDIFHVSLLSLSSAGSTSTYAFHNTFSLSSILYFGHIFLLGVNPFGPSSGDLASALSFVGSPTAKVLLLLVGFFLLRMMWRTNSFARAYLYCASFALLIPSPAYTYRGVILIGYFYFLVVEPPIAQKGQRRPDRPVQNRSIGRLDRFQKYLWVPILAPTTILFAHNSEVSLASILQPAALVLLILSDYYRHSIERTQDA
jgi:hypothetical protein